ncbi:MAG: transporter substrate-binding domain-containing protein [Clostridiales bacterium]|nr:transporter substrate-binding domain-containing protein [Clostridiales bacterium]
MIKKLVAIVLTFSLVLALAGCGPKATSNKKVDDNKSAGAQKELTSVDKIKQAGKIIVGTESTFPPYESIDPKDGKTVIGFDMDIAKAVADKLGVKLEIKDMKFDGLIGALSTGMLDFVAAGMSVTDERKQNADFSDIYYKGGQILVVSEKNNINSASDMSGKKIGAQLGTISAKAAQNIKGIKLQQLDKVDQLMMEIKNGMIDGVVVDDTVGVKYVKTMGDLKVVKIPELNQGEAGMGIAVAKGNKALLDVINQTLSDLKSNGKFDKLVDKWGLLKQ